MISPPDWKAIREDYEGGLSLRALAAKYAVSKSAIGERKYKEQWTERTGNRTDRTSQGVPNRDVNAAVRVIEAIKCRQAGWTYDRIASQCGYADPSSARHAIQRELDRVIVQEVEEWRKDHTSRLEKLHEEVWSLVIGKEHTGKLFAVDRLLAIAEREAKLLGLDEKSEEQSVSTVVRSYGVEVSRV